MNNPVRANEHSEWRSAGYCHYPCAIVWKTGFCDFRVFQTPVSVGGLHPRTSCLRHSYGVIIFRGMKPLNPCSARLSLYRHKDNCYIYKGCEARVVSAQGARANTCSIQACVNPAEYLFTSIQKSPRSVDCGASRVYYSVVLCRFTSQPCVLCRLLVQDICLGVTLSC